MIQTKREALLHQIQRLTIERAMCAPIMDLRGLQGVGPRLVEHTINLVGRLEGEGGVAHEDTTTRLGQWAVQHEDSDHEFAPRDGAVTHFDPL